jgi:hypothetical protein
MAQYIIAFFHGVQSLITVDFTVHALFCGRASDVRAMAFMRGDAGQA